jgi:hypothetical protein
VKQLLVESLVLAMLGGLVSLLVARWTLSGIAALLTPDAIETLEFRVQMPVMLFAAALALATGFLFGLFPGTALDAAGPDHVDSRWRRTDRRRACRGALPHRASRSRRSRSP